MEEVLIVFARQEELDAFLALHPYTKDEEGNYTLFLSGKKVTLRKGGIGKVARAGSLGFFLALHHPSLIRNVGIAGSLSKKLPPFSTLIADRCAYWDADVTAFGYQRGQRAGQPLYFLPDRKAVASIRKLKRKNVRQGLILSGDSFRTKENKPKWLREEFPDALAIDRESAALGQVATRHKIPFLVIRTISDDTGSEGNAKSYEEQTKEACSVAAKICLSVIEG